jgi:7,8-dihydropterin-6-yl-methyl-4-(beta-D-ribofuranosyl)aminobenzene 5'-phosphate synthase
MSGIKHCRGPWAALAVAVTTAALGSHTAPAATADAKLAVQALKITVLVTNLAGDPREGQGEWGYSALVEADGHKILYDTGASADLVLRNARALKIDLSDVEDVVLSHNHWDHVNGLMTLRSELSKINPRAMSRVHVGAGIFQPRLTASGGDSNGLKDIRAQYIATGGAFIVHDRPTQLWPGCGSPARSRGRILRRTGVPAYRCRLRRGESKTTYRRILRWCLTPGAGR